QDQFRSSIVQDDVGVDDDLGDVAPARDVVHRVQQDFLDDRTQAAGTGLTLKGSISDRLNGIVGELELDAIELEELLVLLDERVARLGQDLHQGSLIERRHARNERQAADELRDQTEVHEVFRTHLGQYVVSVGLTPGSGLDPEAEGLLARPLLDDLLQTREGATHDEQHVRGVDLDELLVRVLPAALRRHRGGGALDDLKQRLLDTLAGDVTGDRRVLRLASHLVDLVDVDDPGLGLLDVVVRGLDQLEQDVLD